MLKLIICVCIIIQFLSNCASVFSRKDNDTSSFKKNVKNEIDSDSTNNVSFDKSIDENNPTEIVNFIDPHSLFYDRLSKKVIDNVNPLLMKQDKEILVLKKNDNDCDTLKIYYRRLIMMLLTNANLKTKDDSVEGMLFIKATYNQLETLKKMEIGNYSIKEIDLILSEVLSKTSHDNYFFRVSYLSEIIFLISSLSNYYVEIIVVATVLFAIMMLCRIMSFLRALVIILIMLFVVSFYMTWLHLMKEAEIKLMVSQVKYSEMPIACQPQKMNMWDKLKLYMFDNKECEQYVEARMGNPKLGVTPTLVLSHMFATITLQPIALIGTAISEFTNNATAHLYWLKGPMQIILYLCLPMFFMILVFALRGGSINLGLGPIFTFSFATHGLTSVLNHKRQTIELIREDPAQVPGNVPLNITENNKPVPLPITNRIKKHDSSTDNSCRDQHIKLISNEYKKEQSYASGDSIQNDLLSEESRNIGKECIETITTDVTKHMGSGDV